VSIEECTVDVLLNSHDNLRCNTEIETELDTRRIDVIIIEEEEEDWKRRRYLPAAAAANCGDCLQPTD